MMMTYGFYGIISQRSSDSCPCPARRWTPTPVPDEQCFEAIKAGVDALPTGAKMFLNSGKLSALVLLVPFV
jgi:hypothetical protein